MGKADVGRALRGVLGAASLLVLVTVAPHPLAGPDDEGKAEDGARLYSVYCANCHGLSARGDGPTAQYLKVPPPDLTGLARRNGGVFPAEDVRRTIDGRQDVRGHGERQMPIWGLAFQTMDADANQEEEVRARIDRLVAYLESIQADE